MTKVRGVVAGRTPSWAAALSLWSFLDQRRGMLFREKA